MFHTMYIFNESFEKQIQLEKEKVGYDLENIQSQLEKALGQSARIQKERETAQLEADRLRDKYEKCQVIDHSVHLIRKIYNKYSFLGCHNTFTKRKRCLSR